MLAGFGHASFDTAASFSFLRRKFRFSLFSCLSPPPFRHASSPPLPPSCGDFSAGQADVAAGWMPSLLLSASWLRCWLAAVFIVCWLSLDADAAVEVFLFIDCFFDWLLVFHIGCCFFTAWLHITAASFADAFHWLFIFIPLAIDTPISFCLLAGFRWLILSFHTPVFRWPFSFRQIFAFIIFFFDTFSIFFYDAITPFSLRFHRFFIAIVVDALADISCPASFSSSHYCFLLAIAVILAAGFSPLFSHWASAIFIDTSRQPPLAALPFSPGILLPGNGCRHGHRYFTVFFDSNFLRRFALSPPFFSSFADWLSRFYLIAVFFDTAFTSLIAAISRRFRQASSSPSVIFAAATATPLSPSAAYFVAIIATLFHCCSFADALFTLSLMLSQVCWLGQPFSSLTFAFFLLLMFFFLISDARLPAAVIADFHLLPFSCSPGWRRHAAIIAWFHHFFDSHGHGIYFIDCRRISHFGFTLRRFSHASIFSRHFSAFFDRFRCFQFSFSIVVFQLFFAAGFCFHTPHFASPQPAALRHFFSSGLSIFRLIPLHFQPALPFGLADFVLPGFFALFRLLMKRQLRYCRWLRHFRRHIRQILPLPLRFLQFRFGFRYFRWSPAARQLSFVFALHIFSAR